MRKLSITLILLLSVFILKAEIRDSLSVDTVNISLINHYDYLSNIELSDTAHLAYISEKENKKEFITLLDSIHVDLPSLDIYPSWRNDVPGFNNPNALDSDMEYQIVLSDSSLSNFSVPFESFINSKYGWRNGRRHQGVDIQCWRGDSIASAFDGVVRYTGYYYGYGNLVVVRHYNGLETWYAHLNNFLVEENQIIRAGESIGIAGQTGWASGIHLHFETRFLGQPFNPELLIDFEANKLVSDTLVLNKDNFDPISEQYAAKNPLAQSSNNNNNNSNAPADGYYYIQSGDNLGYIAQKYGVSINQLCSLNNITRNTILQIGWKIRIK